MSHRIRLIIACLASLVLLTVLVYWILTRSRHLRELASDGIGPVPTPASVESPAETSVSHDPPGRDEAIEPNTFSHEPLEACENCHDSKTPDETKAKELGRQVPKLCFRCHEDESKTYRYVHGPVALGQCLFCHDPHKSKYAHLLHRDVTELCALCHTRAGLSSIKDHLEPSHAQCTECHNSHASHGRFLLKTKQTESNPEKRGNVP